MNAVDVAVVVVAVLAAVQGARVGGLVQVCAIIGFFSGLFVGALLASQTVVWAHSPTARTAVALSTMLLVAFSFGMVGRIVGGMLTRHVPHGPARSIDSAAGVLVAVVAALVTVWLLASTMVNSSSVALDNAILQSRILKALDGMLPPPPSVFSQAQGFLTEEGFPPVLGALAPASARPVPPPTDATLRRAVVAAGSSTFKVEGFGCGVLQEGSGFVVAPGLVVTNAHVVAGIRRPLVQVGSSLESAEVLAFDPSFDLAVLRVRGLAAPALRLDPSTVPQGTQGVVLGYPGGGPFNADGAGVMALFQAEGRDIYGHGLAVRNVYEIDADVRPGNSGGPLVLPDGEVVGVVFSRSTVNRSIGYALTSPDILARVVAAEQVHVPVGTGSCAPE